MHHVKVGRQTWLVRGVRTGFQHLVVDTADGLVVADAPAGTTFAIGTEINMIHRLAYEHPDKNVHTLSRSLCRSAAKVPGSRQTQFAKNTRALGCCRPVR